MNPALYTYAHVSGIFITLAEWICLVREIGLYLSELDIPIRVHVNVPVDLDCRNINIWLTKVPLGNWTHPLVYNIVDFSYFTALESNKGESRRIDSLNLFARQGRAASLIDLFDGVLIIIECRLIFDGWRPSGPTSLWCRITG